MMDEKGPEGRLFIAAELPESITSAAAGYARKIEPAFPGRYVPQTNYHVTLAFLGMTPLSAILDLDQALRAALKEMEPFECALSGAGYFGRKQSAIVWAGLTNSGKLTELAGRVRRELERRGFSYDTKPAKPHITLARGVDLTRRRLPEITSQASGIVQKAAVFLSTRRDGQLVYLPQVAIPIG